MQWITVANRRSEIEQVDTFLAHLGGTRGLRALRRNRRRRSTPTSSSRRVSARCSPRRSASNQLAAGGDRVRGRMQLCPDVGSSPNAATVTR
jgi:hypothetical protein